MPIPKKLSSIKRFGARYGRTVKHKFAEVEHELRKKHTCPYCKKPAVKRVSRGIWFCKKCNAKFTGGAYSPKRKVAEKVAEEQEKKEKKAEQVEDKKKEKNKEEEE